VLIFFREEWEGSTTVVYTVVWRNSVVWMINAEYGAVIGY